MTTTLFDAARYLDSEEGVVAFLDAASEGWDCGHIADALEIVSRAKGFDEITARTGVTREHLSAMLTESEPTMVRLYQILDAIGLAPRLERKAA